ncbi:MAG: hypothetical protein V1850_06385 [Candidatus Bathyarchaeota archaeon]
MEREPRIVVPIGEAPSPDEDLAQRIKNLPQRAKLSDIGKEVDNWERAALKKFRQQERTTKSGRLDTHCW